MPLAVRTHLRQVRYGGRKGTRSARVISAQEREKEFSQKTLDLAFLSFPPWIGLSVCSKARPCVGLFSWVSQHCGSQGRPKTSWFLSGLPGLVYVWVSYTSMADID
jgi:hypothetical protein